MDKKLCRILIALGVFGILFIFDYFFEFTLWIALLLYSSVYILIGYDVLWKAIRNITHGQLLDENFLMMVATLGAIALAIYRGVLGLSLEGLDEAVAVMLFYQIGEWFQKYATGKSRQSIAKLLDIRPDYANLINGEKTQQVEPTDVKVGDIILINPGERIPLDGVVIKGASSVDTKSLTGESLPRDVHVGEAVVSGCVNLTSQLTVRVTKVFYDSTVAKILDLVENAAIQKAPTENFITKFARVYTPLVVGAAIILALLPSFITGAWSVWIYRALSFLVVSCPCALVISVPLSFFVAIGTASKFGILVKGGNYLEALHHSNIFVFDKTGTLTKGNFSITKIVPAERTNEILKMAAIAEQNSVHPIARSIIASYHGNIPHGYTLTNVAGAGVIAQKNQEIILCGNAKLLQQHHVKFPVITAVGSVVYVAVNNTYLGYILIEDQIKAESAAVIKSLRRECARVMLLSGDNEATAKQVAELIGIDEYQASLLPQDKVTAVTAMHQQKNSRDVLCFVGDGINDAPALMRADIGIAMGGVGSDAAIEAADVVLMQDDLQGLTIAKKIARQTMKIVKQNIAGSLIVKLGIMVLAALGITNMWLAVFGDVGVAILAILNALRINKKY